MNVHEVFDYNTHPDLNPSFEGKKRTILGKLRFSIGLRNILFYGITPNITTIKYDKQMKYNIKRPLDIDNSILHKIYITRECLLPK